MISPSARHFRGGRFSISRLCEAAALSSCVLIGAATAHQLLRLRTVMISDTERQMARLDMVFAEQTGRAVETVDFILRNAIENLEALRAKPPVDAADLCRSCWRDGAPVCGKSARSQSPTPTGECSIRRAPGHRTSYLR